MPGPNVRREAFPVTPVPIAAAAPVAASMASPGLWMTRAGCTKNW